MPMNVPLEDIRLYNPQMDGGSFSVPSTERRLLKRACDLLPKPSAIEMF